jgi:hypothetical protein
MSCHKKNKSECSSWQGKFYNCRWDDLVGCVSETTKASPRTADDLKKPTLEGVSDKMAQMENITNTKPDDCKIPACRTKTDAFKAVLGGTKKSKLPVKLPCPLESEELGRGTWGLLHTMAANLPDQPSLTDQTRVKQFVNTMADFYPCVHCAKDFQVDLIKNPPRVSSRVDFSIWVCEAHNRVNTKLGKPSFSCQPDILDKRWRDGGNECNL